MQEAHEPKVTLDNLPGFKVKGQAIPAGFPIEGLKQHEVYTSVQRELDDALHPDHSREFRQTLQKDGGIGRDIVEYDIMPAVRACERAILLQYGLSWTPEFSVDMLKRLGSRLATIDTVYRRAKDGLGVTNDISEGEKLHAQLQELYQRRDALRDNLATLEGRFTRKIELYEAEWDEPEKTAERHADRERLILQYRTICNELYQRVAGVKPGGINPGFVDSVMDETRKKYIVDNPGLDNEKNPLFVRMLDEKIEERMQRVTTPGARGSNDFLELLNTTSTDRLAQMIIKELSPSANYSWDKARLKDLFGNEHVKITLAGYLFRKRLIERDDTDFFKKAADEVKQSGIDQINRDKNKVRKDETNALRDIEAEIADKEPREENLSRSNLVLEAAVSEYIGKVVREQVEILITRAKKEKWPSLSVYDLLRKVTAIQKKGPTEKKDIETLLNGAWQEVLPSIPKDRRALYASLFTEALPADLSMLGDRFQRLLRLLGEQNIGVATAYEKRIHPLMENDRLYWGDTLHFFEYQVEPQRTTDDVLDIVFDKPGKQFSRDAQEDGLPAHIDTKLQATLGCAAAVEAIRTYGMSIFPDQWKEVDSHIGAPIVTLLDTVDRRSKGVVSEKYDQFDLLPLFDPDHLLALLPPATTG